MAFILCITILSGKMSLKSFQLHTMEDIDYITSNLYWCDSLHDWIAMKPAYDTKKMIYKVVIRKDLNKPEGLALDPEDG